MDPISSCVLFLVILIPIVLLYRRIYFGTKDQLPGPVGIPFFGNILQIDPIQHKTYLKWADRYGPIFSVNLAGVQLVILSDVGLVKEAFSQQAFSGRMDFAPIDFYNDGHVHGIINSEGQSWNELRRFSLKKLRDCGLGRGTFIESNILEDVQSVVKHFRVAAEKKLSISELKGLYLFPTFNILAKLTTGKGLPEEDRDEVVEILKTPDTIFNTIISRAGLLFLFPQISKHFIPRLSGYNKIRGWVSKMVAFFEAQVNSVSSSQSSRHLKEACFVDEFLKEIRDSKDPKSVFHGSCGSHNLVATLGDLYLAGTDTTAATLSWMTLLLCQHAEVQEKLRNECIKVTGGNRPCSLQDKKIMPYAEAVIAETLRFSSVVSLGVQHKTTQPTSLKGYKIPKDTIIIANLRYIHHDPKLWGDPKNFRPERFITPNNQFKSPGPLLPFSTGKRLCIGESLAMDELFLFATNIIQRFRIRLERACGLEEALGLISSPKPYSILIEELA